MKNTIFDAWKTYPAIFLKKNDNTLKIYNSISNQNFICGPDKITLNKVTNSAIITLLYMIGKSNASGKKELKTGYISNTGQTLYNGINLSFKYDPKTQNIILLIRNKTKVEEIKFCSIKKLFDRLLKKNPTITIKVVEKLLIDGKMKFMFNVTEKDHGTKWAIKK